MVKEIFNYIFVCKFSIRFRISFPTTDSYASFPYDSVYHFKLKNHMPVFNTVSYMFL